MSKSSEKLNDQNYWNTTEAQPKNNYLLSHIGKEVLELLSVEWQHIVSGMNGLMNKGEKSNGDH